MPSRTFFIFIKIDMIELKNNPCKNNMVELKITDLPIDILQQITSIVRNKYNEAMDVRNYHNRWNCDDSEEYAKKHQIPTIFTNKGLSKEYFKHYYQKLYVERSLFKGWKINNIHKDLFYHFGSNKPHSLDNFVVDDITGLDENRFVNDMETCKDRTKMYYNGRTKTLVIRCVMPPQEPFDEVEIDWFDTLYYCNDANVRYSINHQKNIKKFFNIQNQTKIAFITETKVNGNDWKDCINERTDEYETQICSWIECPYNKINAIKKSHQVLLKNNLNREIENSARYKYELMKERSCFKNGGLKYKYKD